MTQSLERVFDLDNWPTLTGHNAFRGYGTQHVTLPPRLPCEEKLKDVKIQAQRLTRHPKSPELIFCHVDNVVLEEFRNTIPTLPHDPARLEETLYELADSNESMQYFLPDAFTTTDRARIGLPEIQLKTTSRLLCTKRHTAGLHSSFAYLPKTQSFTPFHKEDFNLESVNLLWYGCEKVWVVVAPCHASKLETCIANALKVPAECHQFIRHNNVIVAPSILEQWGIWHQVYVQRPGDMIRTAPEAYHYVWNTGPNLAEAVNLCDVKWSPPPLYIACSKRAKCPNHPYLTRDSMTVTKHRPLDLAMSEKLTTSRRGKKKLVDNPTGRNGRGTTQAVESRLPTPDDIQCSENGESVRPQNRGLEGQDFIIEINSFTTESAVKGNSAAAPEVPRPEAGPCFQENNGAIIDAKTRALREGGIAGGDVCIAESSAQHPSKNSNHTVAETSHPGQEVRLRPASIQDPAVEQVLTPCLTPSDTLLPSASNSSIDRVEDIVPPTTSGDLPIPTTPSSQGSKIEANKGPCPGDSRPEDTSIWVDTASDTTVLEIPSCKSRSERNLLQETIMLSGHRKHLSDLLPGSTSLPEKVRDLNAETSQPESGHETNREKESPELLPLPGAALAIPEKRKKHTSASLVRTRRQSAQTKSEGHIGASEINVSSHESGSEEPVAHIMAEAVPGTEILKPSSEPSQKQQTVSAWVRRSRRKSRRPSRYAQVQALEDSQRASHDREVQEDVNRRAADDFAEDVTVEMSPVEDRPKKKARHSNDAQPLLPRNSTPFSGKNVATATDKQSLSPADAQSDTDDNFGDESADKHEEAKATRNNLWSSEEKTKDSPLGVNCAEGSVYTVSDRVKRLYSSGVSERTRSKLAIKEKFHSIGLLKDQTSSDNYPRRASAGRIGGKQKTKSGDLAASMTAATLTSANDETPPPDNEGSHTKTRRTSIHSTEDSALPTAEASHNSFLETVLETAPTGQQTATPASNPPVKTPHFTEATNYTSKMQLPTSMRDILNDPSSTPEALAVAETTQRENIASQYVEHGAISSQSTSVAHTGHKSPKSKRHSSSAATRPIAPRPPSLRPPQ